MLPRQAPELPPETKPIASIAPEAELEEHPFAAIFPMLAGDEAREFNSGIKAEGVRLPIVLFEGKILDGRNRRRAAKLAGIMCPAEEYIGKDALRYVIALNITRRHLTESQRAIAAAEAERFTHGGARRGKKSPAGATMTRDNLATLFHVAPRSVASAAKVRAKGSPELVDAVRQGKVAVSTAAQSLELPLDDQKRIVDEVTAGNAKTAKQVLKRGRVKVRNQKLAATIVKNPQRTYAVILTDDEWKHLTWSERGQDRSAVMHYPTSDLDVLKARALPAFDNAINYMWSVVPFQAEAFEVMKARGFTYRSQFIWWKSMADAIQFAIAIPHHGDRLKFLKAWLEGDLSAWPEFKQGKPGLGYWGRIEHEILLIGTRGEVPCPAPGDNERSVFQAPAAEHSAKPERAYAIIEKYHADLAGHWIEMNARSRRRGWSAWGNEIGLIEPPVEHLQKELAENRLIEWSASNADDQPDKAGADGAGVADRPSEPDLSESPGGRNGDDKRGKVARKVSKAARSKAEPADGIPDFLKRQEKAKDDGRSKI